ncbi:MAG: hypothetical protein NTZ05_07960, partial [Chloroflexi bacterium]|nr:hypothetical protein [Chloroflexota bacterium]
MQPSSDERHVRGRRLRYRTWGAASVPPLVLLGAAGGNLEAVAATLADNWRVIAYDGAEPDNGVEALTDLVDVLGLDRPALAAWGDGVHLALGFAAA